AGVDARRFHHRGLWLGRGAALGPAARRRQCHRDARRGARGVAASRWRPNAVGQDPPHFSGGAAAMRPSLRFLGLALIGWAGVRAAALGILPGSDLFRIERGEVKTPPIVPTQFPAIEPVVALAPAQPAAEQYYPAAYAQPP